MDWPRIQRTHTLRLHLWSSLKDVYLKNPLTLEELEEGSCEACVSISRGILQRVTYNFILRLQHVCCVKVAHFASVLMWYSLLIVLPLVQPPIDAIVTEVLRFLYQNFTVLEINTPLITCFCLWLFPSYLFSKSGFLRESPCAILVTEIYFLLIIFGNMRCLIQLFLRKIVSLRKFL